MIEALLFEQYSGFAKVFGRQAAYGVAPPKTTYFTQYFNSRLSVVYLDK